jgi:branched-chain amino acid transport system substrate-binding protein
MVKVQPYIDYLRSIASFFLFLGTVSVSNAVADEASQVPAVRIGVIQSLSGIAAQYGENNVRALEIARDKINSKGAVRVSLQIEDDRTDSKAAVSAFQKLASEHVDAIIGATWDFTTNPLLPLAARHKTTLFTVSALRESLSLEQANGYAFCAGYLTGSEVKPFEVYLRARPVKKLALLYANNPWGEAQRAAYSAVARANGAEIVYEAHPAGYDSNEWSAVIPRIGGSGAELLLTLVNLTDIETILRRVREQKLPLQVFTSVNGYDAVRLAREKSIFANICFPYPLAQLQATTELSDEFRARYKDSPRIYADSAYDALFLLTQAIMQSRAAGTSLPEELRATRWSGIAGTYTYSEKGSFAIAQTSLVCIKDGEARVQR